MTSSVKGSNVIERETGISTLTIVGATGGHLAGRELDTLYATAEAISPKVILEIGARAGTSSAVLGLVVKRHCGMLYSIECNPHAFWHGNMQRFGVAEFVELIEAVSPLADLTQLPFDVIDYLFLDGDHRYASVLADYRFWGKLVRSGGRIAFHDYFSSKGVRQAVAEVLKADGANLIQLELVSGWITKQGRKLRLGLIVFEKS